MNTMPEVVKAAVALVDAAVVREKYKNRLIECRESGNTCADGYKELKIAYKVAKRKYRSRLAAYTAIKEGSK